MRTRQRADSTDCRCFTSLTDIWVENLKASPSRRSCRHGRWSAPAVALPSPPRLVLHCWSATRCTLSGIGEATRAAETHCQIVSYGIVVIFWPEPIDGFLRTCLGTLPWDCLIPSSAFGMKNDGFIPLCVLGPHSESWQLSQYSSQSLNLQQRNNVTDSVRVKHRVSKQQKRPSQSLSVICEAPQLLP